jgi:UV DNA damage endonuclease
MVHDVIGIPITFDYLHNSCNPPENLSEEDSLKLCLSTWPNGIPPLTHFSESRKIFEDSSCKEVAHSDWLHKKIETYNMEFDIELEVKMKDKALLDYHFNIESILWE